MTTPAARRQIRHLHTQFTGVDGLGPLPSPGPGSTLGNSSGGSGSSPGQTASRRLSKARPTNNYFGSKYTPSPPLSSSAKGPSRESVDEYNQLLRQANYAANHYDSVYDNSTSGKGWNSSGTGSSSGGGLSSSSTSKSGGGTLGHDHARSKTPDGRKVTSSGGDYPRHPYFDRRRSRVIAEDTATPTTTMVAAPPSATPSRPSRNNTANLHDNPFDLPYSPSTSTDAGTNPAKRQRRMSLPSGSAAAHDGQFIADPQEMFASGPGDQVNPYGTMSQSSFSGMRSRSGTQSQKSKKSMLSFMSGTSLSALPSLARLSRFSPSLASPCVPGLFCARAFIATRLDYLGNFNMLIIFLQTSRLPDTHQAS